MDATTARILLELLQSKAPITSVTLANRLDISSRTVKRKVSEIAPLLEVNGARLISSNAGYDIEILDDKRFSPFKKRCLSSRGASTDDGGMVHAIVCALLTNDYVTQDDLASMLFVSRSTVGKVVKRVRALLEGHQIMLSSRPHYGYYLIGKEETVRNFMVEYLIGDANIQDLVEPTLVERCRNIQEFARVVIRQLEATGRSASDPRTKGLLRYFVVTGSRCAHHATLDATHSTPLMNSATISLARQIAQTIGEYFGTSLGEGEVIYLADLLGSAAQDGSSAATSLEASFFEDVVDDCIREVKSLYGRDFTDDETLRRGLVSHLYSTRSRMQIEAVLSLPMLDMVKTQYSEAYDYAVMCGHLLLDRYGLHANEDSLGYIAMHFAAAIERQNAKNRYDVVVVCESGFGTSELLRTLIEARFSNVRVVAVLSEAQLSKYNFTEVALVISTIPLAHAPAVPHVVVTPFFGDNDVRLVQDYLAYFKDAEHVRECFSKELFFPGLEARDKDDALDKICDTLMQAGVMDEQDRASIYHREKISSTEINPLVAMPHCILHNGGHTCYAIFTLASPVDWKHMDVQVVIPMLISRSEGIDRKMFPVVYRLTMDTDRVRKLAELTDFDAFIEELFCNPAIEQVRR